MLEHSGLRKLIRVAIFVVLVFSIVMIPVKPAYALTLIVNSLDDTNDGACSVYPDDCTLREAINAANGTSYSDTINFNISGTINLGSSLPGILSTGGKLVIDGAGYNIKVSGSGSYRPFYVNTGANLTLKNLEIREGSSGSGGGIYNKSNLTIQDCTLSQNNALNDGGGIYNDGPLNMENVNFFNNSTDSGKGGGLYILSGEVEINSCYFQNNAAVDSGGAIYNLGDLDIQGTSFVLNHAANWNGGAIVNESAVEINDSVFGLNSALHDGGAFYNQNGSYWVENTDFLFNGSLAGHGGGMAVLMSDLRRTCKGCVFDQNTADLDGGGFYVYAFSHGYFWRSVFTDNEAGRNGGGGYDQGGWVILNEDTFDSNIADQNGGGFYSAASLDIESSTFSSNSAVGDGGGVYLALSGGSSKIENSTFYDNSAHQGGGIYGRAQLNLINCTISANSGSGGGGGINATQTTVRNTIIAHNPVGWNCCPTITITNGGNNIDNGTSCDWGSDNGSMSSTNPLLGPLQDNGGFTKTRALQNGSPAIDCVIYNSPNECPDEDQRGFASPYSTYCDIGAVEQYYQIYLPISKKN